MNAAMRWQPYQPRLQGVWLVRAAFRVCNPAARWSIAGSHVPTDDARRHEVPTEIAISDRRGRAGEVGIIR